VPKVRHFYAQRFNLRHFSEKNRFITQHDADFLPEKIVNPAFDLILRIQPELPGLHARISKPKFTGFIVRTAGRLKENLAG
jgi:hypothetical protein